MSIINFIFLTGSIAALADGHSMIIHVEPTILLEGSSIEARCDVSNLRGESHFIVWFRRGPIGKEVELATSDHVNEMFSKTGRYTASHMNQDNHTVQYFLTIRDARTSDSGEIGCRIPNSFEIYKMVSVITPITNLQLMSKDNEHAYLYADGDLAVFNEADIINTTCKITASYPQPVISMSTGSQDISHLFHVTHRLVASQSTRWLPSFHYVSIATPKSGELRIRYTMNNKNFSCSAWHHGNLFPPTKIGIRVKLDKYLPKFDCPEKTQARKYQENFKIVCYVRANPGVEHATVKWTKFQTFVHTILSNTSIGNYQLDVEFGSNQTESDTKMVFVIGRMFPQTFRTYQFEASNSLGTTTQEVVVMETSETSVHSGGQKLGSSSSSSSLVALLITIIIAMISSFFHHHHHRRRRRRRHSYLHH